MPERDRNGYVRSDDSDIYRRSNNNRGYSSVNNRDCNDRGDYYSRDNDRRYSNDRNYPREEDDYYGRGRRDDSGGRNQDSDEFGRSTKGAGYHKDPRPSDDYYGDNRRSSRDDYYGGDSDKYCRNRSDSRGGGRYEEDDDWKCKECNVWNYPNERECSKCGLDRRRAARGRSSSSSDDSRRGRSKKRAVEWPPCFEDNGDAFKLDSRSGMFYEAESDFFYDPTSKLYYGNKKLAYFSYNAQTKTFHPVDSKGKENPAPPAGSKGATDVADQDQLMLVPNNANSKEPDTKKMIAIKLKTVPKADKKRKKRLEGAVEENKKEKQHTPGEPANKLQKQHAANIDKWEVRKQEINPTGSRPPVTKHGKPICWVCKRKFENADKLQLHEAKSKLHQDNLAKQKKAEEAAKPKPIVEGGTYVDRAQQRRDMYGEELVLPALHTPDADLPEQVLRGSDRPVENPAINVGQQMLEKLGWKNGKGLGRDSEEQQGQQAALAKDWDRIESLAAQNNCAPRRQLR